MQLSVLQLSEISFVFCVKFFLCGPLLVSSYLTFFMPLSPYILDMINAATMTMDLREGLITGDHLAIMTLTWTDALLTQETMDILGMVVVMVTEAAVLQGLLQGTIIVSALFLYLQSNFGNLLLWKGLMS